MTAPDTTCPVCGGPMPPARPVGPPRLICSQRCRGRKSRGKLRPHRSRRGYRRFSPAEDRLAEQLRIGGMTLDGIAAVLGRWESAVRYRLNWLARRDEGDDDAP